MADPYEDALRKLRADKRSLNELEGAIGLPAETIRDIKRRIVRFPRLDTLKKIFRHYESEAA